MNNVKRIRTIAVLALLLLLVSLPAGLRTRVRASAQPRSSGMNKLSPDLREQMRGGQARTRVTAIVQFNRTTGLLPDLLLRVQGISVLRPLLNLNARVVSLPLSAVEALAERQEVSYISLDRITGAAGHLSQTTGADAVRVQVTGTLLGIPLTTTLDGSGVGVAVLDSGIDTGHTSFQNSLGLSRVVLSQDFTGENRTDDPYGHGTHVASAVAGNGQVSNNSYTGIAPNANIINLRVLDSQGTGTTASLLSALDWLLAHHQFYNIRVVNMSLGAEAVDTYKNDPVCQAVRRLVDAGVVVVAAAGNNGKDDNENKLYGRIHCPGNEPSAITTGASNSFGTDGRDDDAVTTYSSRGPTRSYQTDESGIRHYDNLMKPDLVAPGNRVIWAEARNNHIVAAHPELDAGVSPLSSRKMMYLSGTSMSTPLAAGAAVLLVQLKPELTPNMVKMILMYTAQPLSGFNQLEQGAGELNIEGAVRLAKLLRDPAQTMQTGDSLVAGGELPVPETTIAGQTFNWSQGIILNHVAATGTELISSYQKIYATNVVLGDGILEDDASQSVNPQLMTSGVALGSDILTSDGSTLDSGTPFLSNFMLLGEGIIIGDGIVIGDGIIVGDGIVIGDGIIVGDARLQAQSAMVNGDGTLAMR